MSENEKQLLAMLVNVGGTTSPAIHNLNEQKPPFICFFVSSESKSAIQDVILPSLNYQPKHYDWIETPVPQSLLECYKVLAEDLPRILKKWDVPPESLGVEYTAGTKPMSVAAVLATIDTCSQYFYVGAKDPSGRDRDGIGVVLDGREFTHFQTNPWEELAVREREEIAKLFNIGRFTAAKEIALRLAKVVSLEKRIFYDALAGMIEGYALWDRFEYKQAQISIGRSLQILEPYVSGSNDPLRGTLDIVKNHVSFLGDLGKKGTEKERINASRCDFLDMVANATRRAEIASKYDDAVARLYSALEGLARDKLELYHGIKNKAVKPIQIPVDFREEFIRCQSDPNKSQETLALGLDASYGLLAALGDDLGKRYLEKEEELSQALQARNQSRLAHGTNPIRPEVYAKIREILTSFADIKEDDLPKFPLMEL